MGFGLHIIFMVAVVCFAASALLAAAVYLIDKNADQHDRT